VEEVVAALEGVPHLLLQQHLEMRRVHMGLVDFGCRRYRIYKEQEQHKSASLVNAEVLIGRGDGGTRRLRSENVVKRGEGLIFLSARIGGQEGVHVSTKEMYQNLGVRRRVSSRPTRDEANEREIAKQRRKGRSPYL
jgi:hypothetical protein